MAAQADSRLSTTTPAERRRARAANIKAHKANLPRRERDKIKAAIDAHLAEAESLILTLDIFDGDADFENDRSDYEPNTLCEVMLPDGTMIDDGQLRPRGGYRRSAARRGA